MLREQMKTALLIGISLITIMYVQYVQYSNHNDYVIEYSNDSTIIRYDTINVTVTTYSATKAQCDNNPSKTYSGVSTNSGIPIVGASHDLFIKYLNIGDSIQILTEDPNLSGHYIVHDLGNRRLRNTIDILLPVNSPYHNKLRGKLIIKK